MFYFAQRSQGTYTAAGGVAGFIEAPNFRVGTADTADCVKVAGAVSADGSNGVGAGGVIGIVIGQYVEVYHSLVNVGLNNSQALGGIIGKIGNGTGRTIVKVTDASVTSAFAPGADHRAPGGIYGDVNVCTHKGALIFVSIDRPITLEKKQSKIAET